MSYAVRVTELPEGWSGEEIVFRSAQVSGITQLRDLARGGTVASVRRVVNGALLPGEIGEEELLVALFNHDPAQGSAEFALMLQPDGARGGAGRLSASLRGGELECIWFPS